MISSYCGVKIKMGHCINIYKVSDNNYIISRMQVKRVKLNIKILYHFAIFAIINKKLTKKDRPIRASRGNSLLYSH